MTTYRHAAYTLCFSAALTSLLVGACGDIDPGEESGVENDYYPMAVGDYWTYRESEQGAPAGAPTVELTYRVAGTERIDFGRETGERTVFVVENLIGADATDVEDAGRLQYIEDTGDRAVRHRQDIFDETGAFTKQRSFFPGFLRFDRTRTEVGETWTERLLRVSDPKDGSEPKEETVAYEYEVMETDATVDIDGRSFRCLKIKRTGQSDGETKYYWYAEGIGKVQELTGGTKLEQLIDSSYLK